MNSSLKSAWEVLVLFIIPWGGGIPAGVLLGKSRNLIWPIIMGLYLVSDVLLACVFEPLMRLIIFFGRRSPRWAHFNKLLKAAVKKSVAHYGTKSGPLALILIALGADPMTGRVAARAAGHGFVSGWTLAIIGDMIYFSILMVSTLWLQSILGDGTLTMFIILFVMILAPVVIRRVRDRFKKVSTS